METHVISLGAGVQSSTMALMAACGEITPMPQSAIFADVQAEPEAVYEWLDYLEGLLPFPIIRISKGNLFEESLRIRKSKAGKHYIKHNVPVFTLGPRGEKGMVQRQCTFDYKVEPLRREIRKIIGKKGEAVQWLGISCDEATRMKDSRVAYIKNRYPLIEKEMTRADCLKWMEQNGYKKPPRSACIFCPFHSTTEWKRLDEKESLKAIEYETRLQDLFKKVEGLNTVPFLHASRIPLELVFKNEMLQKELWQNECEGMCGV